MTDKALPKSELVLYQTDDGQTRLQCRFEDDTLWLTQAQMAELFQTSVPNINIHLKAIYEEGELTAEATIKSHLIVRPEGTRQVSRPVLHYSLPATRKTRETASKARQKGEILTDNLGRLQRVPLREVWLNFTPWLARSFASWPVAHLRGRPERGCARVD